MIYLNNTYYFYHIQQITHYKLQYKHCYHEAEILNLNTQLISHLISSKKNYNKHVSLEINI